MFIQATPSPGPVHSDLVTDFPIKARDIIENKHPAHRHGESIEIDRCAVRLCVIHLKFAGDSCNWALNGGRFCIR
jgi:hypothetical protein